MTDEQTDDGPLGSMSPPPPEEQTAGGEPLLPTKLPPQGDSPTAAYRPFGEIRRLPPEEHSHWHVEDWHRGRRGSW